MKQLDPKAVWLFFLSDGLALVASSILLGSYFVVILFTEDPSVIPISISSISIIFFGFVVFLLILSYIMAKLKYHFYRYELVESVFKKEYGIIYKKYVSVPYDRIQNVDIHRSLLARLLGLSTLKVHTAGVGGVAASEGSLPGVSKEVAEQLREELIARARQSRNGQGL